MKTGKRQGFTLVELLVVMAIIAILAAIVVPNVQRYIVRARVTRAIAEITNMQLAMTAMLSDAGRGNLSQMFINGAVPKLKNGLLVTAPFPNFDQWISDPVPDSTGLTNFEKVVEGYTNVTYDLLKYGRNCLDPDGGATSMVLSVVPKETLTKLGPNYMDIGNDPWGTPYKIYPGPWRLASAVSAGIPGIKTWPIIFRKFSVEKSGKDDGFTLRGGKAGDVLSTASWWGSVDDQATWPDKIGYPADASKSVYIWSYGENLRSGQMIYQATYTPGNADNWYNVQDGTDIGGGDDINNWDPDTSWQRFYN